MWISFLEFFFIQFFCRSKCGTIDLTPLSGSPRASIPGETRGFWFTAPCDMYINALQVPTLDPDPQAGLIIKFHTFPIDLVWTSNYDVLYWNASVSDSVMEVVPNVMISSGDHIGIIGSRAFNGGTSYEAADNNIPLSICSSVDAFATRLEYGQKLTDGWDTVTPFADARPDDLGMFDPGVIFVEYALCPPGQILHQGSCIASCPDPWIPQGEECICPDVIYGGDCISLCPGSTYKISNECFDCDGGCLECEGGDGDQCTDCHQNAHLAQASPSWCTCDFHYYQDGGDASNCYECHADCNECAVAGPNGCISCCAGAERISGGCECLPGHFQAGANSCTCTACHESCKECRDTSSSECSECFPNAELAGSAPTQCVCQQGAFTTGHTGECQQCHTDCKSCHGPLSTDCDSCGINAVLLPDQSCECTSRYYGNPGVECFECMDNCDSCENDVSCTQCRSSYFFYNDGCVDQCPPGTFEDGSVCSACHSFCLDCLGDTEFECSSCHPNAQPIAGECVCLEGFYEGTPGDPTTCASCQVTDCSECSTVSDCDVCITGSFLYRGECYGTCPTHTFSINGDTCIDCHEHCRECSLFGDSSCTSCFDYAAVSASPPPGKCVCVENAYYEIADDPTSCQICHQDCKTCSGETDTDCESCYENTVLNQGECSCNPQSFEKNPGDASTCTICDARCVDCRSTGCYGCQQDYFLWEAESSCWLLCSDNGPFWNNEVTGTCAPCADNCLECVDAATCQECEDTYFLADSACVEACPDGFYGDETAGECEPCDSECKKCSSETTCEQCDTKLFLFSGKCYEDCTEIPRMWNDHLLGTCSECLANCDECVDGESCEMCKKGYFLLAGTEDISCVNNCKKHGLVQNSKLRQCQSKDEANSQAVGAVAGSLAGVAALIVLIVVIAIVVVVLVLVARAKKRGNKGANKDDIEMVLAKTDDGRNSNSSKGTSLRLKNQNLDIERLEVFVIDRKDILLKKSIGKGAGGEIYHAEWEGKDCAFKSFKTSSFDQYYDEFRRELELQSSLTHPNIVQFFGICSDQSHRLGLVMELCVHGDLENYIMDKRNNRLTLKEKIDLLAGIASGMHYIHKREVMHRDLKTRNVLLNDLLEPKIIDFGLSRIVKGDNALTKRIGTANYMAPEVALGEPYTFSCDIFSFAIIAWEILAENFDPYDAKRSTKEGKSFIVEFKVAQEPTFRPEMGDEFMGKIENKKWLAELINKAWFFEPKERPTFADIKDMLMSQGKKKLPKDDDVQEMDDMGKKKISM